MPKIVTVEQMRAIEREADAAGHSYAAMMEHAGRAVADRVLARIAGTPDPRIAVIVGPGNNGGDGLVAARLLLHDRPDAAVGAFLLVPRQPDDPVFSQAQEAGVFCIDAPNDKSGGFRALRNLIASADVVIDALFGTSLRLPIAGDAAKVLQTVHKGLLARRPGAQDASSSAPGIPLPATPPAPYVIAVDCPSGLDCDTGALDQHTIAAHETVTFAAAKPGLLTFPGATAVGTLYVADIGLPPRLAALEQVTLELADARSCAERLPARPLDSHKGTFGKALIVAGSLNYIGAAHLAAAAAYRAGAGWVTVGAPEIIVPVLAGLLPEATWLLLPHDLGAISAAAVKVLRAELRQHAALLIGPGLGQEDITAEFLRELLRPEETIQRGRAIGFVPAVPEELSQAARDAVLPPLVLDASALALLAHMPDWPALLPSNTILTPHPGEFARLAGIDREAVQADRIDSALSHAATWNAIVVLKGAFTVVAAPDGRAAVLPFATPALATAGTGDVLAGTITSLLAQGLAPYDAAVAGAYLHGLAGRLAGEQLGVAGVIAGDVVARLPEAVRQVEATR